jgi:hypothetical protein
LIRSEQTKGGGFHELPLVLFTALATAGAGVGTAHLVFLLLGWVPLVPSGWVMALQGVLLAVGLLLSLGHLGRPFRSMLALSGLGRSSLSNEVAVVGAVLLASLGSVALPAGHALVAPMTLMALVISPLVLMALGLVYRLPGQPTWRGPVLAQPLVLGVAFGLTVLLGTLREGTGARGELLVLSFLLADGLLVWERARRLPTALLRGVPVHPGHFARRGPTVSVRILLGILLPAGALIQGWVSLAGTFLFLNLFIDRFLFYGLAVRRNTEAEIAMVEAALRARADTALGGLQSSPPLLRAGER